MFAGLGNSTWVTLLIDGITKSFLDGGQSYSCYLHLKNMNLTELPAGVFDGLEYLSDLYLQNNRLRNTSKKCFPESQWPPPPLLAEQRFGGIAQQCLGVRPC